jgi:hypothetical protein
VIPEEVGTSADVPQKFARPSVSQIRTRESDRDSNVIKHGSVPNSANVEVTTLSRDERSRQSSTASPVLPVAAKPVVTKSTKPHKTTPIAPEKATDASKNRLIVEKSQAAPSSTVNLETTLPEIAVFGDIQVRPPVTRSVGSLRTFSSAMKTG